MCKKMIARVVFQVGMVVEGGGVARHYQGGDMEEKKGVEGGEYVLSGPKTL